jgi:hypothetical protein
MFETTRLLDDLRARYGHFFVARLVLKMGREIPDTFASAEEDHRMALRIREICSELGVAASGPAVRR